MTSWLDDFLEWSMLAASLFNALVMGWLGLTVLLSAERSRGGKLLPGDLRLPSSWRLPGRGTLLASGGLLLGAVFFGIHAASLDVSPDVIIEGKGLWWFALPLPVILLPPGWYLLMLWQAGVRDESGKALRRRHDKLMMAVTVLGIVITALVVATYPQLKVERLPQPYDINAFTFTGLRILMAIYPPYIIVCTLGALDALRHPAPTSRVMGEGQLPGRVAQRRARPYLVASSLVQLAVSLLVAMTLLAFAAASLYRPLYVLYDQFVSWLDWVEWGACLLVGIAVVLLGKAIVSYEIFTGRPLPRRGFLRQWRAVVVGAMAYSALMAWACMQHPRAVFFALLPTALLGIAIAVFAWHSGAERDEIMAALRPLVASQHLYDRLVDSDSDLSEASSRSQTVFGILCRDVLGAKSGFLSATGALAPFAGEPLCFPSHYTAPDISPLAEQWRSGNWRARQWCLPIESERYGGAAWAVALAGEDDLIGILLLGDKGDGGLYALEEIEVARLACERLLDARAGAELAGRLMALQRRRLAETRLLDRGTRRALHDDVLPRIHAAMLAVGGYQDATRTAGANGTQPDNGTANTALSEALATLGEAHRDIAALLREMPSVGGPAGAQTGLEGALQQATQEMQNDFAGIEWQTDEAAASRARDLPPLVAETLFYAAREAMRNAARHATPLPADGAGDASKPHLRLTLQWHDGLQITIEDNGGGLRAGSGARSGSGQGLALHGAMMAVVGGELEIESAPGRGTRAIVRLREKEFEGWASGGG